MEASEREVVQGSIEGCSCKRTPLERRADVADLSADLQTRGGDVVEPVDPEQA